MSARALHRTVKQLWHEAVPDVSWMGNADRPRELIAGVAGALLVVPQAITFAYLAGVPPEFGLYCAIFVGFISSLLGNSALVGGPNTAVSILIGATVLPFAGRGSPLYIEYVFALGLAVGCVQLLIWLLRGAELFRYFSPAAISGIKFGVGVLLITSALEGILGLAPLSTHFFYEKFYLAVASWSDVVNPYAGTIGVVTVFVGLMLKRSRPRSYIVIAMLVGGVVGALMYDWIGPVSSQIDLLGHLRLRALPLTVPRMGPQQWLFLEQVFPSVVAIAVLSLAQTLVIARDLKSTVSSDLDLHKETFAQGAANLLSPFFSTFAGSGSFNRTSVAVDMNARTPMAGIVAAAAVVLTAWLLEPLLSCLPMAAIAGVLVLVGIGMMQSSSLRLLKNWIDSSVFVITLASVLLLGLEVGIAVAVAASVLSFVISAARVDFAVVTDGPVEHIVVRGNLFYASLDRLTKHLRNNPSGLSVLDLSRVSYVDLSARTIIEKIQGERVHNGGRLDVTDSAK